jgi:hypothetical protein
MSRPSAPSIALLATLYDPAVLALVAFAVMLGSAACGAGAGAEPLPVPGPGSAIAPAPDLGPAAFVHAQSGMRFPAQLDGFEWMRQAQYDAEGRDVSSHYTHPTGIVLSVYVFPTTSYSTGGGDVTRAEFLRAAGELLSRSAATVTESKTFWRLGGALHEGDGLGLQALSFDSPLFYEPTQATEILYVFTTGAWHIKFRATFSRDLGKYGRHQVEEFVHHLPWPPGGLFM